MTFYPLPTGQNRAVHPGHTQDRGQQRKEAYTGQRIESKTPLLGEGRVGMLALTTQPSHCHLQPLLSSWDPSSMHVFGGDGGSRRYPSTDASPSLLVLLVASWFLSAASTLHAGNDFRAAGCRWLRRNFMKSLVPTQRARRQAQGRGERGPFKMSGGLGMKSKLVSKRVEPSFLSFTSPQTPPR